MPSTTGSAHQERQDSGAGLRLVRLLAKLLAEALAVVLVGAALGAGLNALSHHPADLRQAVFPASSSGTASCSAGAEAAGPPKIMRIEDAVSACDGCTAGFVDARGAAAFADGHLPGAVHLPPVGHVDEKKLLDPLRRFSVVVVYDEGDTDRSVACPLAEGVAERLQLSYFQDVRVLEGGWRAWQQEGGPAESGACMECAAPASGQNAAPMETSSAPEGAASGAHTQ